MFIVSCIPSTCLKIRRLHDANISGAVILLSFIYLYIVVLVFLLLPTNHINNRYVEKYLDLEPGSTNPMNFVNNMNNGYPTQQQFKNQQSNNTNCENNDIR